MSLALVLAAVVLTAVSGVPGLFLARSSAGAGRLGAATMGAGGALGLAGAARALAGGAEPVAALPWPVAGDPLVGLDALSAFFLVPVFAMGVLGSVYGLGYWPRERHPRSARRLELFWGLMVAGMATLVVSRHALAFLLGWEVMALSAFFLVASEEHRDESRRAALLYLIATHVGTLALFALFALWRRSTGSFALEPVESGTLGAGTLHVLFLSALLAFGLKAGVMPLHFWLPSAHAAAPSHVSAMLSGVVLKMGVYGLLRFFALLPSPPLAWGWLVLLLGTASALLGVVFAIAQHDLKRLLAYHSVENIGIILMGMGLALVGRAASRPDWIVLGMAGCLLHVWNHGLFKGLLFLCAGSVVHATGTREIERLGGLGRAMPWTASLFLVGAAAICGLPPLNGFVSELFVYLGLLKGAVAGGQPVGSAAAALPVLVPVLAMAGALAVACFVKVYGAVFLGSGRTASAARAHEAPLAMRGPMLVLAGCCALLGLLPVAVAPLLDAVIGVWAPAPLPALGSLVALLPVGLMAAAVVVLVAGLGLTIRPGRLRAVPRAVTWDCGYALPGPRMQYTASSFADGVVSLFRWVLRTEERGAPVQVPFPAPAELRTHVDDLVLDRVLVPGARGVERWFGRLRRFQHGLTQHYVLYVLLTVIAMLATLVPFRDLIAGLLSR